MVQPKHSAVDKTPSTMTVYVRQALSLASAPATGRFQAYLQLQLWRQQERSDSCADFGREVERLKKEDELHRCEGRDPWDAWHERCDWKPECGELRECGESSREWELRLGGQLGVESNGVGRE